MATRIDALRGWPTDWLEAACVATPE